MEQNTSEETKKEVHITGDRLGQNQHEFLKMHALTGYDNDMDMIKIAIMKRYLHGLENVNVRHHDPLILPTENDRKYGDILTNPPFAGNVNNEAILEDFDLKTSKAELLFGNIFTSISSPAGRRRSLSLKAYCSAQPQRIRNYEAG